MTNKTIKVVKGYHSPQENEFFFNNNPRRIAGVRELLEFLEIKHNLVFEDIPHWQIQSVIKGDYYTSNSCGLRLLNWKKDE